MITLTTSGNTIYFQFEDNPHYLQNGVIEAPKNSLILVTDDSQMATFKKVDGDVFISALYSELGMTKAELEEWFEENATTNYGGGGGGGDITSGEVQTMIDESISGKADTSAVTESINAAVSGKLDTSTFETYSGNVETALSAKLDASAYTPTDLSEYWTSAQTESAITNAVSGKQDTLSAGTGISISGNVISATGGGGGANAIEVTQAEYDALVSAGTVDLTAFYIITDAPAVDLSGYAQTSAVTAEITAAVSGKVDSSAIVTAVTSASTDSEIPTAKAVYDAIPTGGTSITIDPLLDSGSTNPVANSAITIALNDKISNNVGLKNVIGSQAGGTSGYSQLNLVLTLGSGSVQQRLCTYISTINGNSLISDNKNNIKSFDLVETSAITSAVTSASTDSQIPSAKCVYDQLDGLKLKKVTQAEYDALVSGGTVDSNTLYIIVPTPAPTCEPTNPNVWVAVDPNDFDFSQKIYKLDLGTASYLGEGNTLEAYLYNSPNDATWVYMVSATYMVDPSEGTYYYDINIDDSSMQNVYSDTSESAEIDLCDILGSGYYLKEEDVPSVEVCDQEECTEYECLEWDEETGECIEQGECIQSECVESHEEYPSVIV